MKNGVRNITALPTLG